MSLVELYPDIKHKNPRLREQAMRQVVQERTDNTIDELIAILSDPDVVYRRTAVQTLGIIGPDAVPDLTAQLTHSDNQIVRASCAKALATIALSFPEAPLPDSALSALQQALVDPDPVVKISAIGALGTVGVPAVDILIEAVSLDDIAISVAAISALGSIGDRRATPILSEAATNPEIDPYIRESAQSALSRLEQINQFKSF